MKTNTRFTKSVIATAATADVQMPWTRGARRTAFILKRTGTEAPRKSA